ncbi:MAG: Zn-dependent exopeptidase M28, partial [Gammaproteobacteria bacterium]|nr:Zn-dependent exopeptidase M28 [Gammaproteobacteria bacterium]
RTFVFIATGAEEYGWTDTEFDWAIGAWYAIYEQHPEWIGKTFGYFNLESGGDIGATSVIATGVPETKGFRKSLLPLFDEAFRNNQPTYFHATEYTESFFTTWADGINPCSAGIPTMTVDSSRIDW